MMMAMVKKGKHDISDAQIVVYTSGLTCIIVDHINSESFPGFKRVNLEDAKSLCFKSSAEWITPDTSAEGRDYFENLRKQWIDRLSYTGDSEDVLKSNKSNKFVTVSSSAKRTKTLLDIKEERDRRRAWS